VYHINKIQKSTHVYVPVLCEKVEHILLVHVQWQVALDLNLA